MSRKFTFLTIFAFWLGMNYWLWRIEFGGGREAGGSIPVSLVWEKILKAPDNSSLEINHRDKKLGYLRWIPNIGEEPSASQANSAESVEGRILNTTGYSVDIEGSVVLVPIGNHVRGNLHIEFGKDLQWQNLRLQAQLKSGSLEIESSTAGSVRVKYASPGFSTEHTFTQAELQDPGKLMEQFDLPAALLPAGTVSSFSTLAVRPVWRASNDSIRYGRNAVHVYRLSTKLWDRYDIHVIVSRVGEILRVELPNNLTLKNDILFAN